MSSSLWASPNKEAAYLLCQWLVSKTQGARLLQAGGGVPFRSSVLDDPDASLDLVRRHSNVVLLRTFSKVYGLAGLRCGYALCGEEPFRVAVEQVRQPFFCNALAQAAAEEALRHQDEITKRVEQTIAERIGLEEELRGMGLQVADAQANFGVGHRATQGARPGDMWI